MRLRRAGSSSNNPRPAAAALADHSTALPRSNLLAGRVDLEGLSTAAAARNPNPNSKWPIRPAAEISMGAASTAAAAV
jgi:hypothetical protein